MQDAGTHMQYTLLHAALTRGATTHRFTRKAHANQGRTRSICEMRERTCSIHCHMQPWRVEQIHTGLPGRHMLSRAGREVYARCGNAHAVNIATCSLGAWSKQNCIIFGDSKEIIAKPKKSTPNEEINAKSTKAMPNYRKRHHMQEIGAKSMK